MLQFKHYNDEVADIEYIIKNTRKGDYVRQDVTDVYAKHSKELWLVYEDKKPIAFFGLTDHFKLSTVKNFIYFVATPAADKYKVMFVKQGRKVIEKWLEDYGALYFCTLWRNQMGVRMVKAFQFRLLMSTGDYGIFVKEW